MTKYFCGISLFIEIVIFNINYFRITFSLIRNVCYLKNKKGVLNSYDLIF